MKLMIVFALTLSLAAIGCGSINGSAVTDTAPPAPTQVPASNPPASNPPASNPPASNRTPASTPPASNRAPAPTPTPAPAETQTSLEGRFTYSQMSDYLDTVEPLVQQFFDEKYPRLPDPDLVFIPSGRVARTACGGSDGYAYEYCGGDETIYIGQDLLWAFYKQAGDAAPALALAHEWGHHLQLMLNVPFAETNADSIKFENQADCIAGAWAQYADQKGWLEREDDLKDVTTLMRLIGSAEGSRRDHGTTAERQAAFEKSYAGGVKACNAFFPDEPVG